MDVPTFYTAAQDYGFTDSSNATLLRALQGSVDRIERLRPWPFLETTATLSFTGSSGTPITPPPRYRAALRAKDLAFGTRPKPIRIDDFEDFVGTSYTTSAQPLVYYNLAGVLNFWPLPPSTTTIKLYYLQYSARLTDTSLETDFLIPARHHEAVLFGMLRRLYDQQDDPELAATMAQQHDQLVAEMVEDLTKQQYDEPDFIRLTDPNDWFSV
jgi:hypothetical protein